MTMTAHPALVLNADFRPMSYFPLSLLSWQDAVQAVFGDRVSVVAEYDAWARSPSTQIRLPSVVALRKYQSAARRVAFTRFNVFLRDDLVEYRHGLYAVQYAQGQCSADEAASSAARADAQGVAGGEARVSAWLFARELGGLSLLGCPARGLTSRSSVEESVAVRRRRSRVQVAPRRASRKVPLEWPATRLENGWAPQGVAFEPSTFRQQGCGRLQWIARTNRHPRAQILKRQRGLTVNQVPSGSAGSSPALCTNTIMSVAQ